MIQDIVFNLTDGELLKFIWWCIVEYGARHIYHVIALIGAFMLALLTVVLLGAIYEGGRTSCKSRYLS